MHKKINIKALLIHFGVVLFLSPLLLNPLHFAFAHHDEVHAHETKGSTIISLEKHCNYCDFHFFHFLAEPLVYKEINALQYSYHKKESLLPYHEVSRYISRLYSGRAPPVLS